jgi:hypothetical protein
MKLHIVVSLLALCLGVAARSNDIPPVPIDRQLSEADLVVVGRLGESASCNVEGSSVRCAELIVDVVFKGPREIPGQRRYVLLSSGLGEGRVEILYVPTNALIFMRRREGQFYEPLYSDRSIFALTGLVRTPGPIRPPFGR